MTEGPPDFDRAFRERVGVPNPVLHVLWTYGGRYRRVLLLGVATAAANPLLNLVPPYLLGVAIDAVVGGPSAFRLPFVPGAWLPTDLRGQLLLTFVLLVATALALLVVETTDTLAWSKLQYDVGHDLRTETYAAAQRHGMAFFTSAQTGDVMSVLGDDVEQLQNVFGGWFKDGFQLAVFGLGIAVVMLAMNWQLALVVLGVGIPATVLSYLFHRHIAEKYTDLHRVGGRFNARLRNGISGVSTVKAYANEDLELAHVDRRSAAFRDTHMDIHKQWAYFVGARRVLLNGGMIAILLVGGWLVLRGPPFGFFAPVSVGVFVTFFFYARRFIDRLGDIGGAVRNYDRIAAAGRRVFGLLQYPVTIDERADPDPLDETEGRVSFDGVTFRYPGTDEPALRDVCFEVEPGAFVGVVGPTGAGKSTLIKLLLRFYDPDDGTITLDGHDLRDLGLADLRGSIGYVQQEPFLFDDTVRNNLTYGNREATDGEIVEAAKRARAHGFVVDLPEGYDTEVGERGVKLSGGQRQRLAIARTLLEDPEILILDEATSHVDNETEVLIQSALDELIADRTTVAIAHRLSTVRPADTLLVFEDGEIVERGAHEALLDADGLYATLWHSHLGEPEGLPDDVADG